MYSVQQMLLVNYSDLDIEFHYNLKSSCTCSLYVQFAPLLTPIVVMYNDMHF